MVCLPGGCCHRVCHSVHQRLHGNLGWGGWGGRAGNSAKELKELLLRPSTWMVCGKLTDKLEAEIHQCIHWFTHSFIHPSLLQSRSSGALLGAGRPPALGTQQEEKYTVPAFATLTWLGGSLRSWWVGGWRVLSSEEVGQERSWVGGAPSPGDLPD